MPFPPVRPARPADSERIRELQSLLAEPSDELLSTALAERQTASPVQIARLLVSPDPSGRPVGYLLAVDSEPTHIAELAVDPEYRRQNRATALLDVICEAADGPVTVCVAATNRPARLLYEKRGFGKTTRTAGQFKSGDGMTLRYDPDKPS